MAYKPNMSEFEKKFANAARECSAEAVRCNMACRFSVVVAAAA